jgi:hypothetical protein
MNIEYHSDNNFFKLLLELKEVSINLIHNTDKRSKKYKNLNELILCIENFENTALLNRHINQKDVKFLVEIDNKTYNDLKFIKNYMEEITINNLLKNISNQYKQIIEKNNLIRIDKLINIKKKNINILNSEFTEKYIKKDEMKILYSKKDILINNNESFINLLEFYLVEKENTIPIYIPTYLTVKQFNKLYN